MTAETAFDSWGGVVEYYFECVTGNDSNSGWDPNTTYISTDLDTNTTYGYRVKARDERGHETQWSAIGYAVTGQLPPPPPDTTPPTPVTWASVPTATGSTSITMTSTISTDGPTGTLPIEYYFECTDHGEANSVWQTDPNYVATGLTPSTLYTFRVRARDGVTQIPDDGTGEPGNKTGWSDPGSATTTAGTTPDTNAPVFSEPNEWEVPPYETGSGLDAYANMTAGEATDLEGNGPVEYYFQCVGVPSLYRDWSIERTWTVYVGPANQYLQFHFRVRDSLGNTSVWSTSLPSVPR
jgi:hypothetical protein